MTQRFSSLVVYPGSFDPITLGHLDIIRRAHSLFREVIVAVADSFNKDPLLPIDERIELIETVIEGLEGVRVERLKGLLVDFARKHGAKAIIRGLRAVSDFEYEFKMAWMNRRMAPDIETIFLIPSEKYAYISSSLVKEIVYLGGDVSTMVPEIVARRLEVLRGKLGEKGPSLEHD